MYKIIYISIFLSMKVLTKQQLFQDTLNSHTTQQVLCALLEYVAPFWML